MSWYEVETKVHVKNPGELRARLAALGKRKGIVDKRDTYYYLPGKRMPPHQKIRVREKGTTIEVNVKESESYIQGVHVKKEVECVISDKDNFIELLKKLGFVLYMPKHKRTELFTTKDGVNLELNYVNRLGWYLEIEILCEKKDIASARKKIVALRNQLGFSMKDVEKRGYTHELFDKYKR